MRRREPTDFVGLLDSIVGNRGRTWRAVCLLLAAAVALAVALLPVIIVISVFGIPGAAAVGSVATTIAIAAKRANRRRPS